MASENVEVVRGIYDAWRRGDFHLRAGEGPLHRDFEFEPTARRQALGGGPWRGDEELRAMTRDWFKAWDWVWFEVEQFIDAGDGVVVFAIQRSRLGESEMRAPVTHVWTFRDGTCLRWESFDDRAAALRAVGLEA